MAVVGLLATMTGLAALNYSTILDNWRLNAAARQIVLDLKRVRVQAIAEGTSQRLCFEQQAASYKQQRKEKRRYVDEGPPIWLPEGITVTGCTARHENVSFHPRGHAGSFGTITLANRGQRQRRIIVDMVGRTRVE